MAWADRKSATVIAVSKSGKSITVQEDTVKLLNGADSGEADALKFTPGGFMGHTSGVQRYEIKENPEGRTYTFSMRKNGCWVLRGESPKGTSLTIGERQPHYDYNF